MTKKDYNQFVRDYASTTTLYDEVLNDLLASWEARFTPAQNVDDLSKIEIGVHYLLSYTVQLVNDVIEVIAKEEGWEESAEMYREMVGLRQVSREEFEKLVVKDDLTTEI